MIGQPLIPQLVMAARRLELEYLESKHVWDKRPREESFRRMGRAPVSVKWVDINKGDDDNPAYRSRFVCSGTGK